MAPINNTMLPINLPSTPAIKYLLETSNKYIKLGEFSFAKCYLMMATAMAPENIHIKYETYKMCKIEGNVKDAAIQFIDLFNVTSLQPVVPTPSQLRSKKAEFKEQQMQFIHLKQLFQYEMKFILYSIADEWSELSKENLNKYLQIDQSSVNDFQAELNFHKQLYLKLKKSDQVNCLTLFSNFYNENLEVEIDVLLYIIGKNYISSESLSECATMLIKIKQDLENRIIRDNCKNDNDPDWLMMNHLRQKYIFCILPTLFTSSALFDDKHLIQRYIFDSLKYFIEDFIFQKSNKQPISRKHEYEQKLIEIIRMYGSYNQWQLFKNSNDFNFSNGLESTMNLLSTYVDLINYRTESEALDLTANVKPRPENPEPILYYSLLLFVICFSSYVEIQSETVVVERLHTGFEDDKLYLTTHNKKRKLIQHYPQKPKLISSNKKQIDNLNVLTLLKNYFCSFLKNDFEKFLDHVNLRNNDQYIQLMADLSIKEGSYADVTRLFEFKSIAMNEMEIVNQVKYLMQMIMVYSKTNCGVLAIESIFNLVNLLPRFNQLHSFMKKPIATSVIVRCGSIDSNDSTTICSATVAGTTPSSLSYCDIDSYLEISKSNSTRHVILLPLTMDNILAYIIDVLVCKLKDSVIQTVRPFDISFGHMMVLCQYSWPYYYHMFQRMVTNIMTRLNSNTSLSLACKLTYSQFSTYIFNADIIEELTNLTDLYENLILDFNPITNDDPNQPLNMHSTRGVTRTYKEDIKNLLHKQMILSSNQLTNEMFINFIQIEMKQYFIQSLKS